MNIHTSTVLPESQHRHQVRVCACALDTDKMRLCNCVHLSDLEFIGDMGGDVGAGVSASSSSSSPHSSSLRGVMLLPNHTE